MKQPPKLALIGYGRMGQEIHRLIAARGWPEPCIVDPQKEKVYESVDDLIGRGVQTCVEFTTPDQAVKNIKACVEAGLPVVSGTTGWDHDRERVAEMVGQHNGACLHASNFSLGVYFFQRIVLAAAAQLADFPQYDLAIHETHHTGKKDAPSGTALMLARSVLENCPRKTTIATTGPSGPVDAAMLSVTSTRVGTVVGEHRLIVDSESDSIELVHKAKGRQGFAEGALLAAEWIRDKHGMFTLEDLINDITET